jgi:glutamate 5-kinase
MPKVPSLIVAKVGSSTLVDENGTLDRAFIRSLCDQVVELAHEGTHVVFVSSGAAAAGCDELGLSERPSDIMTLQACAAAGQAKLTEAYADVLAERGIPCGQVLLTRRDVVDREAYLNARNTLMRLIELGAMPVVNENDTVSVAEFAFGDNDMLGAIVAGLVSADLYVILSDVDGLYTANPQTDPTARLIDRVSEVDSRVSSMAGGAGTSYGTGGMASKVRAARAMLAAGIPTVICRGRGEHALVDAAHGVGVGTRFETNTKDAPHELGRKLWIGLARLFAERSLWMTARRVPSPSAAPRYFPLAWWRLAEPTLPETWLTSATLLARSWGEGRCDTPRRTCRACAASSWT